MANYDYDLFVIGAGSGGVRAGRLAALSGAKVGMAEEHRVGGTCVIRGCVPKKLFVMASKFAEDFEDAIGFGWTTERVSFDWATLVENKDKDTLGSYFSKNAAAHIGQSTASIQYWAEHLSVGLATTRHIHGAAANRPHAHAPGSNTP